MVPLRLPPLTPPPQGSAQRMLVFASRTHTKNFSPDVEAPGEINKETTGSCGGINKLVSITKKKRRFIGIENKPVVTSGEGQYREG